MSLEKIDERKAAPKHCQALLVRLAKGGVRKNIESFTRGWAAALRVSLKSQSAASYE